MTLFDLSHVKATRDRRTVLFTIAIAATALGLLALTLLPHLRADLVSSLDGLFGQARRAHLELPVSIAVFVATAYIGAPQAVLIGACVLAFGPTDGFLYAWIATIFSGAVTYQTARASGVEGGDISRNAASARVLRRLGQNGFLASLLMRFVPGPPFILVNVALASARVGFWPYIAGLAIGVLPKTAIIAFAGGSLAHILQGELGRAALLLAGISVCLVAVFAVRVHANASLKAAPPLPADR